MSDPVSVDSHPLVVPRSASLPLVRGQSPDCNLTFCRVVYDAALSQQTLSIHRLDIELSFAHHNRGGAATGFGPTDKMASSTSDMTIDDAWESVKSVVLAGWSKTTRRMRAAGAVLLFLCVLGFSSLPSKLSSRFKHQTDGRPAFSRFFSSDLQSRNLPYPGYLLCPSIMVPMVLSRRTTLAKLPS